MAVFQRSRNGRIRQDLTGKQFGRWTVIAVGIPINGRFSWLCRCECGATKSIRDDILKCGHSQSCGCIQRTHGKTRTPEYRIWQHMLGRCYRTTDQNYALYGGRGISVCKRWRHSFDAFLKDMGTRPSRLHTIDRINNDGSYEPSNCRWATQQEQMNNVSYNRRIAYHGQNLTLAEWSRCTGLAPQTISRRINRGWSVEKSLEIPSRVANPKSPV